MTPFFLSTLPYFFFFNCLQYLFLHLFENCQNSFSWGPPFGPFWSATYLNFGSENCVIRILSRFDSRSILIKESKKPGCNFSIDLRTKFAWSHGVILLSTHLKQGPRNRSLETGISKARTHKSKPQKPRPPKKQNLQTNLDRKCL